MKLLVSGVLLSLVIAAVLIPAIIVEETGQVESPAQVSGIAQQAVRRISALPVRFEPAAPAAGHESAFIGRGFGHTIFLTPDGATVSPEKNTVKPFRMQLVGGNTRAAGAGTGARAGVSNYLLGGDRSAWRTAVPNYSAVRYTGVYPGVDLLYYGKQRELEYDFIVAPHTPPEVIALRFSGVQSMKLTSAGDLQLLAGERQAVLRKPIAYQQNAGGRTEVACQFALRENGEVGFELGDYDASLPLLIDPILSYSTFLGGTGDDPAASLAVDASGNMYVTGRTTSAAATFPETSGAAQVTLGGNQDVYVAKISAAGALVYATYIGGVADDRGFGIHVDDSGNAHVTGTTFSNNFPRVGSQANLRGASDAFVARLNSSGSALTFSAYLGGDTDDAGQAIQVNSAGDIFVVGATNSTNFPTSNALQSSFRGVIDGFVVKLNSSGATQFATFFGGNGDDRVFDAVLDSSSNLFITGTTSSSSNFQVSNAFQSSFGGIEDAFVAKLSSSGSLMYSTYLGGSGNDAGDGIALDASGSAHVTGFTTSSNFPRSSAFQSNIGGGADAFVTKLSPSGNNLVFSTFLGGSGTDQGVGIGVDGSGRAVVVGSTASSNFNNTNAIQSSLAGGGFDAFVAMFAPNGSSLVYSTYLGGAGNDEGFSVRVNSGGTAFLAGETTSGNLATVGAFQAALGGQTDGFVARVEPTGGGGNVPFSLSVTPNSMTVNRGQAASYNVNVTSVGGAFNSPVNLGCGSLPTATSCTFSPASVTPGAAGATATLSIRTTAPAAIPPSRPLGPQSPLPMIPVLLILMTLALLAAHAQRRQLRWRLVPTAALLLVIAMALGAQVSCGGGGGSTGGGGGGGGGGSQAGTAPGTYTVAVSGTSGAMQASTSVTLIVQ